MKHRFTIIVRIECKNNNKKSKNNKKMIFIMNISYHDEMLSGSHDLKHLSRS